MIQDAVRFVMQVAVSSVINGCLVLFSLGFLQVGVARVEVAQRQTLLLSFKVQVLF